MQKEIVDESTWKMQRAVESRVSTLVLMMIDDGRERMEGEGRMEGRQLSTTEDKLVLWKKK
jgi:hypothetical protein